MKSKSKKPRFTIAIHARFEVRLYTDSQLTPVPDLPTWFNSTFEVTDAMPQLTHWLTDDKTRSLEVYAHQQKEDGGKGAAFLLYEVREMTDEARSCSCPWIIPGKQF